MNDEVSSPTQSGPTPNGTSQAYLLFGICFVLAVFLGGTLQSFSFKIGLATTQILFILAPALIFIRVKGLGLADGLRFRRVRPAVALVSCGVGLGTWALGMTIARGLDRIGLKTFSQGLDSGLDSPQGFATSVLVVAVGAGVCEEAMFRGAIQGVLERKGKWFGILVTAALFGMLHTALGIAIPAALMGIFYGWLVIRTGSIIPAMLAHFINNTAALSFVYFFEAKDPSWLIPSLFIVGGIALAMITHLTRDQQDTRTPSPLSDKPAQLPIGARLGCVLPLFLVAFITIGGATVLPRFLTEGTLDDGKKIIYVAPDSFLFTPLAQKPDAQVVYLRDNALRVGKLVDLGESVVKLRDENDIEVEIPIEDFRGVLAGP